MNNQKNQPETTKGKPKEKIKWWQKLIGAVADIAISIFGKK